MVNLLIQTSWEKISIKLAIDILTSMDGAKFEGAVGSTLYIDKVTIAHTSNPDEYANQ